MLDTFEAEQSYLLTLNISVCTESAQPCEASYLVADNLLLPRLPCSNNETFHNESKKITNRSHNQSIFK